MSVADRERLVAHPNLFFQDPGTQKADLLKVGTPGVEYSGTQTELIAGLLEMLDAGHIIELTMVQTGHREDGPNGHSGGKAVDCWPLASRSSRACRPRKHSLWAGSTSTSSGSVRRPQPRRSSRVLPCNSPASSRANVGVAAAAEWADDGGGAGMEGRAVIKEV